ncbi:MAG: PHP domain-containing protein [Melioribacteraceae bacterium]|nr:PHP domain-containing protein [Melioribacteraceae bacterium]
MSLKKELISLLEDMSELMELKGENKFKIAAFKNGANILRQLDNFEELLNQNELKNVKGIGKGLLGVINEFIDEGEVKELNELRSTTPNIMVEMLQIRGMGAKKIKLIYDELSPKDLNDLEELCRQNKIQNLKGFSKKTEESIIDELKRIKESSSKILLHHAFMIGEHIKKYLNELKSVLQCEFVGEMRRIREVISQIELICLVNSDKIFHQDCINILHENNLVLITEENNKLVFVDSRKIRIVIHYFDNEIVFIKNKFLLTGDKSFVNNFDLSKNYKSEQEIFTSSKIQFIIPEMREHEIIEKKGIQNISNSDLELKAFRGFFHFHSTWSDGNNSIKEMIDEGSRLGFKYFALCDHSKSAYYANGLNEKRLIEQHKEIDEINKNSDFRVYKGIESDILKDGFLDYSDEILKQFEFVVASIHSIFNLEEDEMTRRIISAIENPYTDLLAHPTGRLLLTRDGYKVNIHKVIDACSQNDVAIEINANPHRLDLDWRNILYARERGVKFSINPDAHSIDGIHDINYGIMIARKGGILASEVINCFEENDFQKFINRKVKRI